MRLLLSAALLLLVLPALADEPPKHPGYRVLAQDKRWFDRPANAPARLVQVLVKDGDDARSLVASVLAQALVVASMLGIGLIWALARGWQLTLVGFAIAPVSAGVMALQSNLVAKCEVRNKRAREEVAKQYYDVSVPLSLYRRRRVLMCAL